MVMVVMTVTVAMVPPVLTALQVSVSALMKACDESYEMDDEL